MNKLITTPNGGFPLRSNDFRFIDESVRDAFKGVLSLLNMSANEAVILSGCNRTLALATVTWSPGYIAFQGEVLYFAGATYTIPEAGRYWDIETTTNPAGDKILKNGNPHSAYQVREAVIRDSAGHAPSGYTDVRFVKRAWQKIRDQFPQNTDWVLLPERSYDYPSDSGEPKYMRDANGFVHLKGVWSNEDPNTDMLIGRLPNGFNPPEELYYRVWNGGSAFQIKIQTNGEIFFVGTATQTVRLNELPPFRVE